MVNKTGSVCINVKLKHIQQPLKEWKGISVTYSECVFAAQSIQHAVPIWHIAICGLSSCTISTMQCPCAILQSVACPAVLYPACSAMCHIAICGLSSCTISTMQCHAPYCNLWPVRLNSIFPHYLINCTICETKLMNTKCVFCCLYNFCLKHFSF
jgi:hypothetical protein